MILFGSMDPDGRYLSACKNSPNVLNFNSCAHSGTLVMMIYTYIYIYALVRRN